MSYITDKIRSEVALRAKYCCEYCLIYEEDMFLAFEVDHIIAKKHGGGNEIENLAFCCPHCNQHKGSDIATFLVDYEDIIPLFNLRKQKWSEHFSSSHGEIIALSKIGQATIKLLKMNQPDLLIIRQILEDAGRYPPLFETEI